jgi:hypothetical protein
MLLMQYVCSSRRDRDMDLPTVMLVKGMMVVMMRRESDAWSNELSS